MLIYLLKPIGNVIEGLLVSAVVNQDDSHGSLVVGLSDSPESLLACSVPHLQLDSLVVNVDLLDLEVDS
jgi:hypothetical protein